MAAAPAKGKAPSGGKTGGKGRKIGELYTIVGEKVQRKNKFCPKCGPGFFMAAHANRIVCGKCRYTEFGKK